MNKHQIAKAHWRHNETGSVIWVTQKGLIPQTFNYEREVEEGEVVSGFIGKAELKTNWTRVEKNDE